MISNIVFDLGSVLIDGDFTKALLDDTRIPNEYVEDLKKCWIIQNSNFTETCTKAEYMRKVYERSPIYLRKYIPDVTEISITYLQTMNHTLSLINSLKERGYNLYYLSNWSKWSVQELKRLGKFDFLKLFDGGVFSYETGYMKPDRRIYEYFLNKYKLDPSTCIFFDDKKENITAAKDVGMKGILFTKEKGEEILSEFILNESVNSSKYTYTKITGSKEIDLFNEYLQDLLNSEPMSKKDIDKRGIKKIYFKNKLIGYIGLSDHYNDKYDTSYLNINSFMILQEYQRQGHGTNIINDIIEKNKDKYDEINCMVEKDNTKAIKFYMTIGDVYTKKLIRDNLYFVSLYNKYSNNESVETILTTNPFKKQMTLYHGTTENLDIINPTSFNAGTKISRPRNSSFWADEYTAKLFGVYRLIESNDYIISFTPDLKGILVRPSDYDKIIKLLKSKQIYLYEKTLDKKYIGIGHSNYFDEYTVDVPVKPDRKYILKYNKLKDVISNIYKYTTDDIDEIYSIMKHNISKMSKMMTNIPRKIIVNDLDYFRNTAKEYKKGQLMTSKESYIEESNTSKYTYHKITDSKDIDNFYKCMKIVFNDNDDIDKEWVRKNMKTIKYNNKVIGYIGFSYYNQDNKKYLGIGNFMIIPEYQRSGHGTNIIKDIINKNKDKYDEIYCYVDKKNTKAINFYKKIAKVNTRNLTKYGYYVTLYSKDSTNESYIEGSFNKNKRIYHLSETNMDGKTLYPKIPSNFMTKNGYEDNKTKRVCFSTTIDGSLRGMSMNLKGKTLYVHIPDKEYNIYKPSIKEVPDSKITGEVWIKDPIKLKCIGIIKVIEDNGKEGIPYKYGNNTAELYDWNWKWIEKINESYIEEEMKRSGLPDDVFGIPQERKYPMPDEKHTRSAIKLFNHVDPKYEKQLANKIIANMKKYNIPGSVVGDKNRLKKYLPKTMLESSNMQEFETPEELIKWMKHNIHYKNYTKLMSPEEVYSSKKGSCHDQVMFELYHLRKMKKNPKALFLIEYNEEGNGTDNVTHSLVYYIENNKVYWVENAWGGMEGIHTFNDLRELKSKLKELHKAGKFGNYKKYPELEITSFKKHNPGESLQQLVDICIEEGVKDMYNENNKIKKIYFIKDNNGNFEKYHPIVEIKGINKKMRGRSELLVIKDNKYVYLSKDKHGSCCKNLGNGFIYDIAGGGWSPYEDHSRTAIRESEEESRIKATNVIYGGDYYVLYDEPKQWVKDKIDKKDWWYGYYIEVYVGTYNGKYTGIIDDEDKDELINTGKFYPIKDVIEYMNPVHQKAIELYLQENNIQ